MKAPASRQATPKIGKAVDERLNILLNEIKLATTWSRPSILLAVHKSKIQQEQVLCSMEQRLAELSMAVAHVIPGKHQLDILNTIRQKPDRSKTVFFIRGLGNHNEIYTGLNLHREIIVENQIKLIFWLTTDEYINLAHQAPDFWAFRHRVIEFPARRSFSRILLPSGVLLWHEKYPLQKLETIRQKISSQENIVKNIPANADAVTNHATATDYLAHLYWLTGDNDKAENLWRQELETLNQFQLVEMKASLLNGQAISSYDRGAYQEALVLIEEALSKRPEDGILWANHGVLCRAAGQSKRSLASIRKAIKIKPMAPEFQGSMGYMYMSMGKFDMARLLFEKSLNINPKNIQFKLALAFCFSQLGYFEKFEELMKSISVGIRDENSYLAICHTYLQGHKPAALNQLKDMLQAEKIPKSLPARDPSLHFILGIDALMSIS